MEELKTLKDFEIIDMVRQRVFADVILLKQEAIKWVKGMPKDCPIAGTCRNWIKHFFNLTEEDLE